MTRIPQLTGTDEVNLTGMRPNFSEMLWHPSVSSQVRQNSVSPELSGTHVSSVSFNLGQQAQQSGSTVCCHHGSPLHIGTPTS